MSSQSNAIHAESLHHMVPMEKPGQEVVVHPLSPVVLVMLIIDVSFHRLYRPMNPLLYPAIAFLLFSPPIY